MIKGIYGCYCHPFVSWDECEKAHKQKLNVGDIVKNRCNDKTGTVISILEMRGFVVVKFGINRCDEHLRHVAELIKLKQ